MISDSFLPRRRPNRHLLTGGFVVLSLLASACGGGFGDTLGGGDCTVIDLSVSSEKIELLQALASEFNDSGAEVDGTCVNAVVQAKASGAAATLLVDGWDPEVDGPEPVIWSPAASTWASVVNQRLSTANQSEIVGEGTPFMVTPLVIAMPQPMAEALGWPDADIGWSDILALSTSEDGWASRGHPEWGDFRLGKTNPNFSTSGLATLVAQTYAAAGKTANLSTEDLRSSAVRDFGTGVESAVVHYGDTTLTFLNNWYLADQRGAALSYVSAAAVEEKSLIDYNRGNPDGKLEPGETPRPPRIPLVAIYPSEGTLYSDNPLFVLDAPWVDEAERAGAQLFIDYVQTDENQRKVLEFGFRPGNPSVPIESPISIEFGVDPAQPTTLLEVPGPSTMIGLLDLWQEQRKGASVTIVLDVSGSMAEVADPETGATRLDLAKEAIIGSLDEFKSTDQVSLYTFTTNDSEPIESQIVEVVPRGPMSQVRADLERSINAAFPSFGTPLYESIGVAYARAETDYDPAMINAVIVLTDGFNDDGDPADDNAQFEQLLTDLSAGSEGQFSRPIRVFPIAYGEGADMGTLDRIAEAAASKAYSSSDPRSINKVFAEVVSNF